VQGVPPRRGIHPREGEPVSALRAWLTEVDWPIVRRSTMRKRTRNAFELGYDAGEARLRERMYS